MSLSGLHPVHPHNIVQDHQTEKREMHAGGGVTCVVPAVAGNLPGVRI